MSSTRASRCGRSRRSRYQSISERSVAGPRGSGRSGAPGARPAPRGAARRRARRALRSPVRRPSAAEAAHRHCGSRARRPRPGRGRGCQGGGFCGCSIAGSVESTSSAPSSKRAPLGLVGRHRGGQDDSALLARDPHDHLRPIFFSSMSPRSANGSASRSVARAVLGGQLLRELLVQHASAAVSSNSASPSSSSISGADHLAREVRRGEDRDRRERRAHQLHVLLLGLAPAARSSRRRPPPGSTRFTTTASVR